MPSTIADQLGGILRSLDRSGLMVPAAHVAQALDSLRASQRTGVFATVNPMIGSDTQVEHHKNS